MGRWLATLLLVIVAAIAALLIVPSLIDWNGYRASIEREASRLAGRPVTIKGDIGLHMLPSPGFALGDVTIADPKNKTAPLLNAKQIDASLAWLPLFVGRIEFAQLALIDPVIRIQITKSGTANWSDPNVSAPRPTTGSRLKFRDIAIAGGTILFLDDRNGAQSQASKISGHVSLPGEEGSLTAKLDFTIEGQSIRFGLNLNRVVARAPSTFTAALSFLNGGAALTLHGTATGAASALEERRLGPLGFRSTLDLQSASSTSVARGIVALALFDAPHAAMSDIQWARFHPLTLAMTGALDLTGDSFSLTNANGSLGRTRFTASAARGRTANTLNLSASTDILYLDEIIDFKAPSGLRFAPVGAVASPLSGLGLCHCEGEAKLRAPRVEFGTSELTDFLIDLKLHETGAELASAHITLPGESQLDASGSFPAAATDGTVFDGRIAFNSVGPRAFLDWLGLSAARLAPNALKTLSLVGPFKLIDRAPSAQSGLTGTSFEHYPVPFIDNALLSLDDQRLQISASYDDRAPRSLLLHLSGDALDADAYGLSGLWLPAMPLAANGWGRTVWGRALHAGEVDLKIKLREMRLGGHPVRGFDASVNRSADGASNAHIAIDSFSGYRVLLDQARAKSGDTPPDITAHLNISGAGKPIKLPLAGKGLPGSLKLDVTLAQTGGAANYVLAGSSGDIAFKGTGAGPASNDIIPDIETLNLTAHMSQGDIALSGSFGALSTAPDLEGNLTIDALDFAAFLRELGYTYEPRRKDLGALSLVTQLSASSERVSLTELAASVGQDNLSGHGTFTFGARDKLGADLKITHAALADYLPLPEKGSIWSPDRMKLDVLGRFDGNLNLVADRVSIGPYDLSNLSASLTLQDGALETKAAHASLYGGALNASGALHLSNDGFNGTLHGTLNGFDWTRAARKLFPALGSSGAGKADAKFALSTSGRSMVDFVHSLEGELVVRGSGGSLDGFDLPAWSKGVAGVNGIESFLYLAKSSLTNGSTSVSNFSISATANRGVISLGTSHVVLDGGQGTLSGEVTLPSRSLSIRLSAQATAHPDIAPIGIIAMGPIAGPARYYDLTDAAKSLSAQLGLSKGEIEPRDVPRDLRDLIRTPPTN
ncbi:MAG: AsmA family protein [Alphaproteobacteria bacterium]